MQVNVNPGIKMDKMQLNVLEEKNAKKVEMSFQSGTNN